MVPVGPVARNILRGNKLAAFTAQKENVTNKINSVIIQFFKFIMNNNKGFGRSSVGVLVPKRSTKTTILTVFIEVSPNF